MEHLESEHPILYVLGVISLVLSLALILFGLFITPHILFDMTYSVPQFIADQSNGYRLHHGTEGFLLMAVMVGPFFIAGLALGFISMWITKHLEVWHDMSVEEQEVHLREHEAPGSRLMSGSYSMTWKIIALIVLVISFLLIVEYMISV